jgi:hypothetical protein
LGYNKCICGNITRKLSVQLPVPLTGENVMLFIFSFLFYEVGEQESRTSPSQMEELALVGAERCRGK